MSNEIPFSELKRQPGKDAIREADIIYGKDEYSGDERLMYGHAFFQQVLYGNEPKDAKVVTVLLDTYSDELELLIATIEGLKNKQVLIDNPDESNGWNQLGRFYNPN